jgi:hypothetical protein
LLPGLVSRIHNEEFMKFLHPLTRAALCCAMCAGVSLVHAADKPPAPANPADPGAAAPATRYQAVMSYRPAPAATPSPAENWKELNRQVGAIDSMSLTMGDPKPAAASGHAAGHKHTEGK